MNKKGLGKIEWIAIVFIIMAIILLYFFFGKGISESIQIQKEQKSLCETYEGVYDMGNAFKDSSCTIKENGEYVSKKVVFIDDEWRLAR